MRSFFRHLISLSLVLAFAFPGIARAAIERETLLDEVVAAMDGPELVDAFLDSLFNELLEHGGMMRAPEGQSDEERAAWEKELEKAKAYQREVQARALRDLDRSGAANQMLRPLFDERFSNDELIVLREFLGTETGAKMAEILPAPLPLVTANSSSSQASMG